MCALTLFLCLPSHAQFGGEGFYTPSHAWGVTYSSQGSTSLVWLGNPDSYPARGGAWPNGSNGGSIDCLYAFGEVDEVSQGTVTATLTWFPANGDILLDPPDKTVYIRETATAEERPGQYLGPDSARPNTAGTVDNGLGSPVTVTGYGFWQTFTCRGTRLLQCDGSTGKIVLDPVSLRAAAPISSYPDTLDWIGDGTASVSFNVQGDNRSVFISSNFSSTASPTYRKGFIDASHRTGQWENVRASDGSLIDDTVVPDANGTQAVYSPNYPGSWGNDSTYAWQATLAPVDGKLLSKSGVFNSTAFFGNITIPTFEGTYDNPPASDGVSDTITLFLKDGVDGATAANFYTIRFHDPVPSSGWQNDPNSPVIHPLPTSGPSNESDSSLGEWSRMGPYPNRGPGDTTLTISAAVSEKQSVSTTSGTISGANVDAAVVKGTFQKNEGKTIGQEASYTETQSYSLPVPSGYQSYAFWGWGWEHRFGTCDVYDQHGYSGIYNWYLNSPQLTPGGSLTIRWAKLTVPLPD